MFPCDRGRISERHKISRAVLCRCSVSRPSLSLTVPRIVHVTVVDHATRRLFETERSHASQEPHSQPESSRNFPAFLFGDARKYALDRNSRIALRRELGEPYHLGCAACALKQSAKRLERSAPRVADETRTPQGRRLHRRHRTRCRSTRGCPRLRPAQWHVRTRSVAPTSSCSRTTLSVN
jgi:hypothetical protein